MTMLPFTDIRSISFLQSIEGLKPSLDDAKAEGELT